MVSNSQLRAIVRQDLGLTDTNRIPDGTIEREIGRMRGKVSGKPEPDVVRWLVNLRCLPLARGESRIPPTHPQTPSQLRRADFSDKTARYWQHQLNRELTNDG